MGPMMRRVMLVLCSFTVCGGSFGGTALDRTGRDGVPVLDRILSSQRLAFGDHPRDAAAPRPGTPEDPATLAPQGLPSAALAVAGANPECDDGLDNDGDGAVDFPADRDCYSALDPLEAAACGDGVDNDGDGAVDAADPDCVDASDRTEATASACSDLEDNDGDALIDFPADDGCHAASDPSEETPEFAPPDVRPRVLLAVAAAGTLNGNVCTGDFTGGDGSQECPGDDVDCAVCGSDRCGNQQADDSRLASIRTALSEVASRSGDVELGLLRSRQEATEFMCTSADPVAPSGAWAGATPGCLAGSDSGELLVAVGDDTAPAIGLLFDGVASGFGVGGPGFDLELRGTGLRPIAGMLTTAGSHLANLRSADSQAACRAGRYRVVLIADGAEQCGGDPVAAAGQLFAAGIRVHVLGFASGASAALDAIAQAGGTEHAIYADDADQLSRSITEILASLVSIESCNQLDDDCDGLVDEDFARLGESCENGAAGVCAATGSWMCAGDGLRAICSAPAPAPQFETCNGLDDDCDGRTDEGGVCVTQERCDGSDNDGDGSIDEGFQVGASCTVGLGECRVAGKLRCSADGEGVECQPAAAAFVPAAHDLLCDGRDEDCDGAVDEDAAGEMREVLLAGGGSVMMDRYEASRPDAGAASAGAMTHRACSKADVLPWSRADHPEAAAACAAAGKRLCSETEFQAACGGPLSHAYPYGAVYNPYFCNGEDYDPECDFLDHDLAVPTGGTRNCPPMPGSTCVSAGGVIDLSGNLREWTSSASGATARVTVGGSFLDQPAALKCSASETLDTESIAADVGFRCCSDGPLPPPPPLVRVALSGSGSGTVSSQPEGIHCPSDCQQEFDDADVMLEATPYPGSRFVAWSGDCAGTVACVLDASLERSAVAIFEVDTGPVIFQDGFEGSD